MANSPENPKTREGGLERAARLYRNLNIGAIAVEGVFAAIFPASRVVLAPLIGLNVLQAVGAEVVRTSARGARPTTAK